MDMTALKQTAIQKSSNSILAAIGFIRQQVERAYEQLAFMRLDLLIKAEQAESSLTHLRSIKRRRRGYSADCLGMVRTQQIVEAELYRIKCLLIFCG